MLQIITNNIPREFIYGYDLPESVREDFDYMTDEQFECADFVKYKDRFYDVSEFMSCTHFGDNWHGYAHDTAFSGVLIRVEEDSETCVMATYLS